MARRFLLVGLFVVWPFQQGQVMQLGFAAVMSMWYLMVQSQAAPYRSPADNALALGCSFSLCILWTPIGWLGLFCPLPETVLISKILGTSK